MPRLPRTGFVLALAAVAAATAAAVLGVGALASAEPRAAASCGPPPQAAATVTSQFVHAAVLRLNQACSYELVTGNVRQGYSRAEWARGDIPVVPYPTGRPETLTIERLARNDAAGERSSIVVLQAADLRPAVFELVLVRSAGRWLVDYWGPVYSPRVPSG